MAIQTSKSNRNQALSSTERISRISTKELLFIVEHGTLAPSGDNMQPWKFELTENGVDLYIVTDPNNRNRALEAGNRSLYVSAGAVIENMRVAAAQIGYSTSVQYFPNPHNRLFVAAVNFEQGSQGSQHFAALRQRATNRRFFNFRKPVDPGILGKVEGLVNSTGKAKLMWMPKSDSRYRTLSALVGAVDTLRFSDETCMEDFDSVLRMSENEALTKKDGLAFDTLEAGLSGKALINLIRSPKYRNTMRACGLPNLFGNRAVFQMFTAQAAGLLVTETNSAQDFVNGGEVLEKMWHELTNLNIAFQPMSVITYYTVGQQLTGVGAFSGAAAERFNKIKEQFFSLFGLNDRNGLILLFRIGYAQPPSARALRKPVSSFLLNTSDGSLADRSLC